MLHNNIKKHFVSSISRSIKVVVHLHTEWMSKNFENLQLPIFISFILKYFFYCPEADTFTKYIYNIVSIS